MRRALLLVCAVGCGDKEPVDSALAEFCADAPVVTWDNFGAGFILQECQPCHASTTANRQDAPENVTFDTVDQTWAWADRVLARAASEPATMPPQGGVDEDDRVLLEVWLLCAAEGT